MFILHSNNNNDGVVLYKGESNIINNTNKVKPVL